MRLKNKKTNVIALLILSLILCAIQGGKVQCSGTGSFGDGATGLYEDSEGNLWVSSATGVWRWKPGAPQLYRPAERLFGSYQALSETPAGAIAFATERGVYVVLKGDRSVIAAPDGRVWVNPTGSPALATGGTGDVLTGMIAGLVAQFPEQLESALLAAVYLHGRAGELGAAELGEKTLIATDLFEFLPEAMREVADLSH